MPTRPTSLALFLASLSAFATLTSGCGSRTPLLTGRAATSDAGTSLTTDAGISSAISFPVGTWSSCAVGLSGSNTNLFLAMSEVISSAALTVTQNGASVTASYTNPPVDGGVGTFSFAPLTFSPTTDSSAVLQGGGEVDNLSDLCVQGPENEAFVAATMSVSAGSLAYDASTVFLALTGTITGGEGSACGSTRAAEDLWIVCGGQEGPTTTSGDAGSPALSFPGGSYSCATGLATYAYVDGIHDYGTSGANGTLVVTQTGSTVTASYTGDTTLSGTLDFTVTSPTTAASVGDQSLAAMCDVVSFGPPPDTEDTLSVTAATLMVDDGVLFLSFRGTLSPSCASALATGSLVCTKP